MDRKQTLADVSRAIGIDPANLSRIETKKQPASPELAERLTKHYGSGISELEILYPDRFGEGEPSPAERYGAIGRGSCPNCNPVADADGVVWRGGG